MLYENLENQAHRPKWRFLILAGVFLLATVGTIFLVLSATPASKSVILAQVSEETYKRELFKHWKQLYGKDYLSAEDHDLRFSIWSQNYDWVEQFNQNSSMSFKVGMNQFADLTNDEYKKMLNIGNCLLKRSTPKENSQQKTANLGSLPKSVDWRKKGAVTPVKNQGQCGSCWAFSTTGSLEGLNFITKNKLISFSEQQLIDCSESYGNLGCNGGLMDYAFKYAAAEGLESESIYPYTAADGKCKYSSKKVLFQNGGYEDVDAEDNEGLTTAVASQPVSIGIEADSMSFQMYTSGVYNDSTCGTNVDHGVLIVGYGTDSGNDYWIVKNSWGDAWGESGYIRIARQSDTGAGVCGIATSASYPTANSSSKTEEVSLIEIKKGALPVIIGGPEGKIITAKDLEGPNQEKPEIYQIFQDVLEFKHLEEQEKLAEAIIHSINNISMKQLETQIDEIMNELETHGDSNSYNFVSSSVNYRRETPAETPTPQESNQPQGSNNGQKPDGNEI